MVKAVDRRNFGLCLDTYNIAGREFGDPSREDGMVSEDAGERFSESMKKMVREVDVEKVFYVQVVDGERVRGVLGEGHEFFVEGQKPRMSWSRNARLFVCEEDRGGYLPVLECVRSIMGRVEDGGLGYTGWVSMELFNRSLGVPGQHVPKEHAERAVGSWNNLISRLGWAEENLVKKIVDEKKEMLVDEGVDMGEDMVLTEETGVKESPHAGVENIGISSRL